MSLRAIGHTTKWWHSLNDFGSEFWHFYVLMFLIGSPFWMTGLFITFLLIFDIRL